MQEKRQRNSSIELLRIVCIFGIITMHSFAPFMSSCSGKLLIYGIGINSLFNCGVTIFMLISGYYGCNFSGKKIVRLESMTILYGIIGTIVSFAFFGGGRG